MRKLLLATAAVLGGTAVYSGAAFAQAAPVPTTVPTPSFYTFLPSPTPGPGTITVRLNARIAFMAAAGSDSGRAPTTVTSTASSATSLGSPQTNTKLADYTFGVYGRFYPGFDGIAGNGLKYGAGAELREDNGEAPGGGINGSISGSDRNRNVIYWRREYLYVGTDQAGFVRFGQTDGPGSLYLTGSFENFNDGAWNGDLPSMFTGGTGLVWPFADVGQTYDTTKIVYLSPQFAGFDFGASFAPNSGAGTFTPGNCPYGVTANAGVTGPIGGGLQPLGCDAASSTSSGDYARGRNFVELGARYRGSFGPVGVAVEGTGFFSGKVTDNATPQRAVQFNGQQVGQGGLQVTYGGFAVGGTIQGGESNLSGGGGFGLQPKGTPGQLSWVVGTSYAFGPLIVGASYIATSSAGSATSVNQPFGVGTAVQYGVAAGATYNFAPGMNVFLAYLYGHRRQNGVDLLSGATSASGSFVYTHNNVQAQGVGIGTAFRW